MDSEDIKEIFSCFLAKKKYTVVEDNATYPSLYVKYDDLLEHDANLVKAIIDHPDNTLIYMKEPTHDVVNMDDKKYDKLTIRLIGFPLIRFRALTSLHMNTFVTLQGIINKVTPLKPMIMKAIFKCKECAKDTPVLQHEQYLDMPSKCEGTKKCESIRFTLDDKLSTFVDSQELAIQEGMEDIPAGQIPRRMELFLTKDLVEKVRAGDLVTVSGVIRISKRTEKLKERTFTEFIEVNNIIVESKEASDIKLSDNDIEEIKKLVQDPNFFQQLLVSFIPSIYGNEVIKEAMLYLLFGGVKRETPDGSIRGEMNVLLIGDPACAKSQLLKGITKYAPRAIFTTGMGSSGVGLTASVIKQENGEFALEAGAFVLGDKGIICIDEMDKMEKTERAKIHEAMEQHTVSISKARFNTTLNARCAVLGAANPAFGRYDEKFGVAHNLSNFPTTLLSRFDLIFIMKDIPDENLDDKMTDHILKLRTDKHLQELTKLLTPTFFKKYISYAKRLNPNLTPEAQKVISTYYKSLRKSNKISPKEADNPIAITPRQLEAIARIAEANARMHLHDDVTEKDAIHAVEIMKVSLNQCAIDPDTGEYNIDMISFGGKSKSEENNEIKIYDILRIHQDDDEKRGLAENLWIERSEKEYNIDRDEFNKLKHQLLQKGKITEYEIGYWKIVPQQ